MLLCFYIIICVRLRIVKTFKSCHNSIFENRNNEFEYNIYNFNFISMIDIVIFLSDKQ